MRSQVASLVRQILQENIPAHRPNKKTDLNVYVLLGYPSATKQAVWEHIRAISDTYEVQVGVTDDWQDVPENFPSTIENISDLDRYELLDNLHKVDLMYVPVVSYGLLAKMALTIDDDLLSWLIIQLQMAGKRILLADDELQINASNRQAHQSVANRIQSYWRQLERDGIEVTSKMQFQTGNKDHQQAKKTLLSVKQIEMLSSTGVKEIFIPKNQVITPLAKDRARELEITLHWEGHEKRN